MTAVKTVPQALADLGRIHDERGKDYGEDYLHIGEVLMGMFPDGLHLKTSVDFNRFALLLYCVTKTGRYAQCLAQGKGHEDSLDDLSVYAQLLQRFDAIVEKNKNRTSGFSLKLGEPRGVEEKERAS